MTLPNQMKMMDFFSVVLVPHSVVVTLGSTMGTNTNSKTKLYL